MSEEEGVIHNYFGDFIGCFLDIGAFDGLEWSNTAALIKRGWSGVLVEPTPQYFSLLLERYSKQSNLKLVHCALGGSDRFESFHYTKMGGISTFDARYYDNWKNQVTFVDYIEPIIGIGRFLQSYPGPYDFINIDAEGMDAELIEAIPLNNVRMVCIESGHDLARIRNRMAKDNFVEIGQFGWNVIFRAP